MVALVSLFTVSVASQEPMTEDPGCQTHYNMKCNKAAYFTCRDVACASISHGFGSSKFVKDINVKMYECLPNTQVPRCVTDSRICGKFYTYATSNCTGASVQTNGYQSTCN